MKIGYVRVSTQEQSTLRQEVLMRELGVDEVYIDHVSGTLNPGGLTTRTQAAVILQCFIETVAK